MCDGLPGQVRSAEQGRLKGVGRARYERLWAACRTMPVRWHTGSCRHRHLVGAAAALTGAVRTLDAIHVASAEVLGSELTALVTYDIRMADAARASGLPVATPGAE